MENSPNSGDSNLSNVFLSNFQIKLSIVVAGVDLKIAQVSGDNLYPIRDQLFSNDQIKEMSTGKSLPKTVHSMTAYYGAGFPFSHFLYFSLNDNLKHL